MKNFSYLFMAGFMTLGLWSCSDDSGLTPGGNEEQPSADKVYMSFKLELPTAGRSATNGPDGESTHGVEVGKPIENTVSTLDVVLAESNAGNYKYITKAYESFEFSSDGSKYTASFESEILEGYKGKQVNVFVFCNYPSGTDYKKIIEGEVSSETFSNPDVVWTSNKFWMANKSIVVSETIPNDLSTYTTKDNAFKLVSDAVSVERAAARFDYASAKTGDKYDLEVTGSEATVQVQLTDMALVNMSNNFNYLRRVAAAAGNQYDNTNVVICGPETSDNYVVDSDADTKMGADKNLPNNFLNYWSDATANTTLSDTDVMNLGSLWSRLSGNSQVTTINSLSANDDTDGGWADNEYEYKIWRYAIENTLPSIATQIKSLSTGVLFRGKLIEPKFGVNGYESRLADKYAYVYNNKLYGSWEQVKTFIGSIGDGETDIQLRALKTAAITLENMRKEYAENKDDNPSNNLTNPTKTDAVAFGFTVYEKDTTDDCFYVYYYYINRHNDNGKAEDLGVMEYAVVRNNVYKLAVTGVSKYGHPGDPAGDPDPETPSDPDETKNIYFQVSVKVLPWVVRVNNIEF